MGLSIGLTTGCVLKSAALPTPPKTPITILGSNLLQWWEIGLSETTTAPTVGFPYGTVSDIGDESPNNYGYSAIGSQQAAYEFGGWNGMPSMSFDGSNDFFTDTNSGAFAQLAYGGTNTPSDTWLVLQAYDTSVIGVPVSCGGNASTPLWDLSVNSAGFNNAKNSGGISKTVTASPALTDRLILRLRNIGNQVEISINNVVVKSLTDFSTGLATFLKDCIGGLLRNTFSVPFFGRMVARVTASSMTVQQANDLFAYLSKFIAVQTAPMLLINGDSLSFPPTSIWPNLFAADYPNALVVNNSASGQALFNYGLPNKLRDTMSNYDSNRSISLLAYTFGSNDVVDGQTATQIYNNLMSIATQSKSVAPGRKIILATIPWRGGLTAGQESVRQAANTSLRSSIGAADYLWEKDLIITSADYPALFNPPDQTHPNDQGNYYLYNGRNSIPGFKHWAQQAGFP